MYTTYPSNYNGLYTMSSNSEIWMIISILVAVCLGIVSYFTFLNPKNAESYTGFTKKLYDFLSFKVMTLESILKICYLIIAIYITMTSFSYISTSFVLFLITLFAGNIIARIIFEGALLIIMIYRQLVDLNEKFAPKKKKETTEVEK